MSEFWLPLTGGFLIALSAALLLLANGRIAGISGILGAVLGRLDAMQWAWRVAFLIGLMGTGGAVMRITGQTAASPASLPVLLIAGFLVGVGTRMGSGCTSGHGVCGLGRLSIRSLVAVIVFMTAAIATVYLVRHGGIG